ncbi:class I SAM-dependent methyltransferase [Bryocella elongata]|uniref:class I SAM-dependent methyltransferase n=1 Tax=Bryocella elongata TaxID=863522 RepID=UPI002E0D2115
MHAHLQSHDSLRVLDFGATSPSNINYLTALGHSVYMANIVQDASRPEWLTPSGEGVTPEYDVERFVSSNLDFSGRDFDVVLLWDTADYLPKQLVPAVFDRLRTVLRPDGRLLAFFHGKIDGTGTRFSRYQLTNTENLDLIESGEFPMLQVYPTRQIEKFFEGYSSTHFYLGKDNVREVIAVR